MTKCSDGSHLYSTIRRATLKSCPTHTGLYKSKKEISIVFCYSYFEVGFCSIAYHTLSNKDMDYQHIKGMEIYQVPIVFVKFCLVTHHLVKKSVQWVIITMLNEKQNRKYQRISKKIFQEMFRFYKYTYRFVYAGS